MKKLFFNIVDMRMSESRDYVTVRVKDSSGEIILKRINNLEICDVSGNCIEVEDFSEIRGNNLKMLEYFIFKIKMNEKLNEPMENAVRIKITL